MSVNNEDRNVSVCVLCKVRRPQKFSQFCEKCFKEHKAEARQIMGMDPDDQYMKERVGK